MKIYAYTVVYDTGFAPCVYNYKFTIACCKTLLRHTIEEIWKEDNDIYIMGLCGKQLANRYHAYSSNEYYYTPVFIAKISECQTTEKYYSNTSEQRPDKKYLYKNNEWSVLKGNPHYEIIPNDFEATKERDLYYIPTKKSEPKTNYVLISEKYVYWGKNMQCLTNVPECIKKIADIRSNACRADRIPISLSEDEQNKFIDYFNNNLCITDVPNSIHIDKYFENSCHKGECKNR